MNAYEFMSQNAILTTAIIYMITVTIFRIFNRFIRHLNIRNNGWPPAHCDADGDFKVEDKE